ncbi:MAG TPA: hypothetical protein VGN01_07665 [Acidobacteriaceae bacterium]
MTFEALLTFASVLIAAYAIARPVQRRSVALFVPSWLLPAALLLAFGLLVVRDAPFGVKPLFHMSLEFAEFSLTASSFVLLVAAAGWCVWVWHSAILTPSKMKKVEELFQAALLEGEFDEVERVIRKNHDRLTGLPPTASSILFQPKMVTSLTESGSLIHLELLSDLSFLKTLESPFRAVDAVVRDLLVTDISPLRTVVIAHYGGHDAPNLSDHDSSLLNRTFLNPDWYKASRADYPLTISAIEALGSGRFDAAYNARDDRYDATQGISTRASCPIYLALKTQTLAIEAVLNKGITTGDFYVTGLMDVFRTVLRRSQTTSWNEDLHWEFPTPYAYLLHNVIYDLQHLSELAVRKATTNTTPPVVAKPGEVARWIARTWTACTWLIASPGDAVSDNFQENMIQVLLNFILQLHSQPSEIYPSWEDVPASELLAWRDLFVAELREKFVADKVRQQVLKTAINGLDYGKGWVFSGRSWLELELQLL